MCGNLRGYKSRVAYLALAVIGMSLSGCDDRAAPYTLYRNSHAGTDMRIHWATFAADESSPTYNFDNCSMTARLLNANMKALNGEEYDSSRGFWCEPGTYNSEGVKDHSFSLRLLHPHSP
jgi:hypothetical protein